jgi:outer membrane protein TolC
MAPHPDCLKAWSLFHSLRVHLVAATVRTYVDVLAGQERLLCVDLAIRLQSSLLQCRRASSIDRVSDATHSVQAANLPELHLHRVRLQGERDAAVAGLAWLVGEPLNVVLARIDGHLLPPAISTIPASGTPDALELRRPDLLAVALQSLSQEGQDTHQARVDAIRREQAFDRAVCEVERALAVLTSAIGESVPARATALSAGNRAGALVERMRVGQPDYEAMVRANRLYHGHCDREIEVRARGYRALVDLYEALGAGWPAPIETGEAR